MEINHKKCSEWHLHQFRLQGKILQLFTSDINLDSSLYYSKEPPSRLHPDEIDTEAALMQALAEREEDDRLDYGAVEINSVDEFTG